jgi:hypothetical protein
VSLHPYHTTPHLVPTTSPDNLCKGRVMRDWLALESFDKVVYCGDGGNDFEGAMCVPEVGASLRRVHVAARAAPRRQYRRSMRGMQHAYEPCLCVSVWQGGTILAKKGWSLERRLRDACRGGKAPQARVMCWETQVLLVIVCHNSTPLSLLRVRSACHIPTSLSGSSDCQFGMLTRSSRSNWAYYSCKSWERGKRHPLAASHLEPDHLLLAQTLAQLTRAVLLLCKGGKYATYVQQDGKGRSKPASLFSEVGIPYVGQFRKRFIGSKHPANGNTRLLLGSCLCRLTWPCSIDARVLQGYCRHWMCLYTHRRFNEGNLCSFCAESSEGVLAAILLCRLSPLLSKSEPVRS